jgi:hypothetical protein
LRLACLGLLTLTGAFKSNIFELLQDHFIHHLIACCRILVEFALFRRESIAANLLLAIDTL